MADLWISTNIQGTNRFKLRQIKHIFWQYSRAMDLIACIYRILTWNALRSHVFEGKIMLTLQSRFKNMENIVAQRQNESSFRFIWTTSIFSLPCDKYWILQNKLTVSVITAVHPPVRPSTHPHTHPHSSGGSRGCFGSLVPSP